MSLNRLHKERPRVSTHFEEVQVPIQVLNGAQGTVRSNRRFVDLAPWGRANDNGVDESDYASEPQNQRSATFANEMPFGDIRQTLRFLRDLDNKSSQRNQGDTDTFSKSRSSSVPERSSHRWEKENVDEASQVSTSEDLHSWNILASKRKEEKPAERNLVLKPSKLKKTTTTMKRKPVSALVAGTLKSPRLDVMNDAIESEGLARPFPGNSDKIPASASSPKVSRGRSLAKTQDAETDELEKECRAQSRERQRLEAKPWHNNMKRLQDNKGRDASGNESERKREKKPGEERERPWRSNMKAGAEEEAVKASVEAVEEEKKRDSNNIRRFMKEKRDKARKAEMERKVQEELKRKNIQVRLKALDLERRSASTVANKVTEAQKTTPAPAPGKVKGPMAGAISVNSGNSYVRQLLEGLTSELRAGKAQRRTEGAAKNVQSPKDINGHGDQEVQKLRKPADDPSKPVDNISSAALQKKSCSEKSSSSSSVDLSKRATAGTEVNDDVSKTRAIRKPQAFENDVPVQDPERAILSGADKLNRKVSDFYARYHMDLELIRASNLGIRVPTAPNPPAPPSRQLNNAPASLWWPVPAPSGTANGTQDVAANSDDDTPPRLHHAESPTPDPFNFIAAVRRKIENNAGSPASEGSSENDVAGAARLSPRSAAEEESLGAGDSVRSSHAHRATPTAPRGGLRQSPVIGQVSQEDAPNTNSSQSLPGMDRPDALRLRFRAELNQFESMQEVEKHLNNIGQFSHMSNPLYQDVADGYAEKLRERRRARSRQDFEVRINRALNEIITDKFRKLSEQRDRENAVRAEAKRELKKITSASGAETLEHTLNTRTVSSARDALSSRESAIQMLSRAESNIPEILGAIERAERSEGTVLKTISEVIRSLTVEEEATSKDVTEDIAHELSEDYSARFESDRGSRDETHATGSSDDSTLKSRDIRQPAERELQPQQQPMRASASRAKYREALALRSEQAVSGVKEDFKSLAHQQRLPQQGEEGRRERKPQAPTLRRTDNISKDLKSAERQILHGLRKLEKNRSFLSERESQVLEATKKLGKMFKSRSLSGLKDDASTSESESVAESVKPAASREPSAVSTAAEHRDDDASTASSAVPSALAVASPSKMESLKKSIGTTLKSPMSPKTSASCASGLVSTRRQSGGAGDSDDSLSISQGETISDHSDVEIRINTLQDDLRHKLLTVAKLKRQQKVRNKEKLRVQEEALKRQIEQYDRLIRDTVTELEEGVSPVHVVQPLIKTPKQILSAIKRSNSQSEKDDDEASQDNTVSIDSNVETVVSTPVTTPVAVPEKQFLTEKHEDEIRSEIEVEEVQSQPEHDDADYADDFTESSTETKLEADAASPERRGREHKRENLAEKIAAEILDGLLHDAVKCYKSGRLPKKPSEPVVAKSSTTTLAPGRARPQELMLTTFDISSESSDEDRGATSSGKRAETSVSPSGGEGKAVPLSPQEDSSEGHFIDDDFGLSLQREAELLRQQQLLIEQEINRIQRGILDKPPPPYTPPSSPVRIQKTLQQPPKVERYVPSTQEELRVLVSACVKDIANPQLLESLLSSTREAEGRTPQQEESRKTFVTFVVDLVKELMTELAKSEQLTTAQRLKSRKPPSKSRLRSARSEQEMHAMVLREVMILFGFEKRAQRENLVVRWSQKRRDRVDQILVRELHAEEANWTDYSHDEAMVENQIATQVWDLLIADTAREVAKVFSSN